MVYTRMTRARTSQN